MYFSEGMSPKYLVPDDDGKRRRRRRRNHQLRADGANGVWSMLWRGALVMHRVKKAQLSRLR